MKRVVLPSALEPLVRRATRGADMAPGEEGGRRIPTGVGAVDEALGGGLLAGRLSEIAGARSSGKTALALSLAARRTGAGELAAWVDGSGQLYPPAAAALGVDLARLLLARLPGAGAAGIARAAEIVAQSRAFSLVVVDFPAAMRPPRPALRRLRAAAQRSGAAVVVLTTIPGATEGASTRLELRPTPAQKGATRAIEVRVSKGSKSGAPARVAFELGGVRIDDQLPLPLPPVLDRALPGEEPAREEAR
jgi:protein ImuA